MNFDLDIFTAIHITSHYFSEHAQKHFEMLLRTLELFDRADKKVTKYPKFIKMLGCFGVSRARSFCIFDWAEKNISCICQTSAEFGFIDISDYDQILRRTGSCLQ